MIKTYIATQFESLSQTLAKNVRNNTRSVFDKRIIVTQSVGMNSWLKIHLAQKNGILTQTDFLNPDGLFGMMYQFLYNEWLKNNADNIRFEIYRLLNQDDFKEKFSDESQYYVENPKRRFDLASKVADLFDQYQVYRPTILEEWEKGTNSAKNRHAVWQMWLWNRLKIEPKYAIKERMKRDMHARKDEINARFPSISIFGVTVFTDFHLDFFKSLSEITDVKLYVCLPFDPTIASRALKNDLLQSFGAKAKELNEQISGDGFSQEIIEKTNEVSESDLQRLQSAVISDSSTTPTFANDATIQIHSCFTPVREVECLYNFLLDAFEKNPHLQPRDVLVITTDIDKYAPFVKAVFRNAPKTIPFQVSGSARNNDDTLVTAIEQLLLMNEMNFTSERVVSLLESNRIRKNYQISDTAYIRAVVNKANIRFGMENSADDDSHLVSWKYGLEKIILGFAMLNENKDEEFEEIIPYRDAEALVSYDLFRLKKFVDDLHKLMQSLKENRTLNEWKKFLWDEVIDSMIFVDDFSKDDRNELSEIYRALSFTEHIEISDEKEVPFAVFFTELQEKLFLSPVEHQLNTGRVTITSAVQVRGLPHKIICFIGLNNGVFPRQDRFFGFDLLGDEYLTGDRSKKETDKYLFLDTLLSARQRLYLSYIGQSAKDNTTLPPSIVLDVLAAYTQTPIVKQPLHGFSALYNDDDKNSRLFTYLYGVTEKEFEPKEKQDETAIELSVCSFTRFFEAPIDWYFNNILSITYDDDEEALPETELFELDYLEKWFIKNDLLVLPDDKKQAYVKNQIKQGNLPLRNMGRITVDELWEEISDLKTSFEKETELLSKRTVLFDSEIGGFKVKGEIPTVYDKKYVAYSFSTNIKYKVRAYIHTLLLCFVDEIDKAVLIEKNGKAVEMQVYHQAEAEEKLMKLLEFLKDGMKAPLKVIIVANTEKATVESVKNDFHDLINGNFHAKIPVNPYMNKLNEEGYFDDFSDDDFEYLKEFLTLLNL